jgi:hypothetical protein
MLPLGLPYISTLVSQLSTSLTCGLSILDYCVCVFILHPYMQVVVTHGGMLRESFHHSKRVHGRVVINTMIANPEHMLVKRSWL